MQYTPQELALAIRKLIESHPENWEQGTWYSGFEPWKWDVENIRSAVEKGTCGTTACVAGWAAILTSPKGTKLAGYDICQNGNLNSVVYPDGRVGRVQKIAEEALGLTNAEGEFLFNSSRTQNEVIAILTAIENGFDWYEDPDYLYPGA